MEHRVVRSIAKKWERFWEGRTTQELADCDPCEVARIAGDLGLSAQELRWLAAHESASADLVERRLQDLWVDPEGIDRGVLRDLQLHCTRCSKKSVCARELEDKPMAASWPKYCPNELTINALVAMEPRTAPLA
jgi:hypothetical protein